MDNVPPINGQFFQHSELENHHAKLIGKPSISMGNLYHGYVSHNQRVVSEKLYGMADYHLSSINE